MRLNEREQFKFIFLSLNKQIQDQKSDTWKMNILI